METQAKLQISDLLKRLATLKSETMQALLTLDRIEFYATQDVLSGTEFQKKSEVIHATTESTFSTS